MRSRRWDGKIKLQRDHHFGRTLLLQLLSRAEFPMGIAFINKQRRGASAGRIELGRVNTSSRDNSAEFFAA